MMPRIVAAAIEGLPLKTDGDLLVMASGLVVEDEPATALGRFACEKRSACPS
jgi:hypothetical protein